MWTLDICCFAMEIYYDTIMLEVVSASFETYLSITCVLEVML